MFGVPRREFLLAAGALLAAPLTCARANKPHRVVWVLVANPGTWDMFNEFFLAMRDLGYVAGKNLVVDFLIVDVGGRDLPATVDEAIARRPDVLIGWESVAQVMRSKTTVIPIVLPGALDPVKAGLANSLRRPGLNVTGLSQQNSELFAKHLEILREMHPRLARVGLLLDDTSSGCRDTEASAKAAAERNGVSLMPYHVGSRADIQDAFDKMEKDSPEVLLTCPSALLYYNRALQYENAMRLRIPMTSHVVQTIPPGVLFALAADFRENYRRLATYVDKILRGAKPGDLPIEQPIAFELVLNLDTARAAGFEVPQSVLLRANRVIDSRAGE